ncbi:L-ascorbate metabolism protein UlaG, beta-lactamase superfamily [Actinomadura meyerae]|jgi:L-ascorbate metabolism protein UlaG (beta-lactamase superfamily)|uniref:L-ascorbate metabolism protein UlaG, beta-lactamase superfamily n=1 Tax=Actinomadura meyerae TaxID=240840 RepID=A0A239I403_9ACTN|nr:MBL fold metallo-hydrolase [Actinomadura meyerae]SNS87074.1 L-ascorbate metabolism protein UlaG, beta-lactamase superfamily [Actinomadura meyerae]
MRLTKLGHACVQLTENDRTIVIDPGAFSDGAAAVAAADAVLITHEHFDHFDADALRAAMAERPELEVWTSRVVAESLADLGGRVHQVGHGDAVTIAGFDVHVYGEEHEILHPDVPPIPNVGFLVNGEVFHPGDAWTVPSEPVPTLCLPGNAPWMKIPELIQYTREVRPERAFIVHDGLLNDIGLQVLQNFVGNAGKEQGKEYVRLTPGTTVDLAAK